MIKFRIIICLSLFTPLMAYAYDLAPYYSEHESYMPDNRGNCTGKYYELSDIGNKDKSRCEDECDNNKSCVGYSFKQGSCILRKNMHLCPAAEWTKTSGYTYYTKPIEFNFMILGPTGQQKLPVSPITDASNRVIIPRDAKNPIKYCLQVPARARTGDKLETVECSIYGHKGQLFTLVEAPVDPANYPANVPKPYKIKHIASGLCIDILEFTADNNATRLWPCDLEPDIAYPKNATDAEKNSIREARISKQYFRSSEIPALMANYTQPKVKFRTQFGLSVIPKDYLMLATGDCTGSDISGAKFSKTAEECAAECTLKTDCKGFNYNYAIKECNLKSIAACTNRNINGFYFYSKTSALKLN